MIHIYDPKQRVVLKTNIDGFFMGRQFLCANGRKTVHNNRPKFFRASFEPIRAQRLSLHKKPVIIFEIP